jgi:hypothetical protein
MEHERMRWGYMSERQLLTRLNKIKREAKLECYMRMALELGRWSLLRTAIYHAMQLGFRAQADEYQGRMDDAMMHSSARRGRTYERPPEPPRPSVPEGAEDDWKNEIEERQKETAEKNRELSKRKHLRLIRF